MAHFEPPKALGARSAKKRGESLILGASLITGVSLVTGMSLVSGVCLLSGKPLAEGNREKHKNHNEIGV